MSKEKRILIICLSNLRRDPRVYRQILFLKDYYHLTAAGFGDPGVEGVNYVPLKRVRDDSKASQALKLKLRCFEEYYWSSAIIKDALQKLNGQKYDLIIANDGNTLPFAVSFAKDAGAKAKVLLDAHEYEPRHVNDQKPRPFGPSWRFDFFFRDYYDYIYRQYLSQVDAMVTVCQSLAEEYSRNFGVKCGVIANAPFHQDLKPTPIAKDRIRLIHHGGTNRTRRLEKMIFLMDYLDNRFTLDLMLVPNDRHNWLKLRKLADRHPRVCFRDAVAMQELPRTLNQYDIGIFLLWPADFHYRMALPNKLFEFIQGRLAVAIWPSPEMARIVRENRCGIVAEDFTLESAAKALNSLTADDVQRFKEQSHQAASQLCAETNRDVLLRLVRQLIGS